MGAPWAVRLQAAVAGRRSEFQQTTRVMDSKIKARFWTDPEVEAMGPLQKLALLWLMTAQVSDCGWVQCSRKRFEFDTGVAYEDLNAAVKALGTSVVVVDGGFWLKNYIREQLGAGEKLASNTMSSAIARASQHAPAVVKSLILENYPELKEAFSGKRRGHNASPSHPHPIPIPSPCASSGSTREERRGEENENERRGVTEEGGAGGDGVQENGGSLGDENGGSVPAVEPPFGFPGDEATAVRYARGLALRVKADPDFVRDVWRQVVSRGFRDGADVQVRNWGMYVARRVEREQEDWLAKRKLDASRKNNGAESDVIDKPPPGWKAGAIEVLGWEPDGWEVLDADNKGKIREWLRSGKKEGQS